MKKNQGRTRTKIIRRNVIITKWTITKKSAATKINPEKESANNVTEYVIYEKIFTIKTSNQKYDIKTFIVDSGSTSHMKN